MRLAEIYERAVNWPTATGIAGAIGFALVLVVVGFLLSIAKRVWIGRTLGLIGLVLILLCLFDLTEQTTLEKPTENITVVRYRRSERTRLLLFAAMLSLPCAAGAVMWVGFVKSRFQRRRQAPRLLKEGRRLFAQKEFEAALRTYSQAIQAAPDYAEAYCRRGLLYHEMGQPTQALADIDRAIACDPRHATAYLERGKCRTATGDFDGALADFGELMIMRANDPETFLYRGICLVKKGHLNEAAVDFRRVLKLTNHSDFAEPAKSYLRQIEDQPSGAPLAGGNGALNFPPSTQPRAQDHALDRPIGK
jgi:tetratricopeptide (TPR) repeat protein